MEVLSKKDELERKGFSVIEEFYSEKEVSAMLTSLAQPALNNNSFLKSTELFAIRQLLNNIPNLTPLLFNEKFKSLIATLGSDNFFLSKALYFDKPRLSNWFVPYHQDLSISVDQKQDITNYTNWTFKKGQYGVHPPLSILERIITIRIHLDDTNEQNGALNVIPNSHHKGILRFEDINVIKAHPTSCPIKRGGIMLMKPLTLHASNRSQNNQRRRVIHLEFCDKELALPLQWLEKKKYFLIGTSNYT